MHPLIGIPTCLDVRGRWKPGRAYQYIDTAYARAIAAAGGVPVYLGVGGEPEAAVAKLDGLLIPGGDDLPPPAGHTYPDAVAFDLAPDEQIAFDRAVLGAALARNLPILGICYGMQLLALQHGGRLHYDLETDAPSAGQHQLGQSEGHAVEILGGSQLASSLGRADVEVNSRHHQAVAEPGAGLRVCARAGDGVVEALEALNSRFTLGVQWHPESLDAEHRGALFGAFVAACAQS